MNKKFILTNLIIFSAFASLTQLAQPLFVQEVEANTTTATITFNDELQGLTNAQLLTNQQILNATNNTSSIPLIASSVTSTEIYFYLSGGERGLDLKSGNGNAQNPVASFRINFNPVGIKFNSFFFTHDRISGTGVLNATLFFTNAVTNLPDSFLYTTTDNSNTFVVSSTTKVNGTITGISFEGPTSSRWIINDISLTNSFNFTGTSEQIDQEMANFSGLILSYSPLDPTCTVEPGTTRASSTDLDDLQFFYNQMTTEQKNTFKQNYPNAWGRLQFLFSKANRTIS